jgi:hypothetical protein
MSDLGASFTREYEQTLLGYEQRIRKLELGVVKLTGDYMHTLTVAVEGMELHHADYNLLVKLRNDIAHLRAETRTELAETKDLLQTTQKDIESLKQDKDVHNARAVRPRGVAEPATSSIPLYSFPEP